ncbi:MAG: hypothetical protein OXC07_01635 [Kistimonas sp.]|nr:hypothetical protein [Kistimonas sp.]
MHGQGFLPFELFATIGKRAVIAVVFSVDTTIYLQALPGLEVCARALKVTDEPRIRPLARQRRPALARAL